MARLDTPDQTPARMSLGALGAESVRRVPVSLILGLGLMVAAAVSYAALYLVLTDAIQLGDTRTTIRVLILVNFVLGLALFGLVAWNVVKFFLARQQGHTGSRLHVRLVGMFTLIAVVPAIVVAVFSVVTLNLSLETWFDDRVENAVDSSLAVANNLVDRARQRVAIDVEASAGDLYNTQPILEADSLLFAELIYRHASLRGFSHTAVHRRDGTNLGTVSAENFEGDTIPPEELFVRAEAGETVTMVRDNTGIIGMAKIPEFEDGYLFVIQELESETVLLYLEAQSNFNEYNTASEQRSSILWLFALSFLVLALIILLFAVWMGLAAAGRIVSPIGRLVGASERVSEGDLSARVDVGKEDDEIATLSRSFNRMTGQLQTQRDELIEANRQYDRRRRFTEAVLAGVSAGVVGFDGQGHITIANRSALALLNVARKDILEKLVWDVVPELKDLVTSAMAHPDSAAQGEVDLQLKGRSRNLTVQVTGEAGLSDETAPGASRSFVVTFDDVTDLVSAQRMSAWADVARRIAHEIKNPLTPIQLSAERLRRKYMKEIETDPQVFDQCTETIIRQVGDIGKMVDEFSAFARLPEAVLKPHNLVEAVRDAVFLQRAAFENTEMKADLPKEKIMVDGDERQLSQALINLLKNAAEAVETRRKEENDLSIKGHVLVRFVVRNGVQEIEIIDNGCGLPKEQQHRLTEPYVTTREKGTGIGLAIVKKIMEDHGGELILENAPEGAVEDWDRVGARIRMVFPEQKVQEKPMPVADLVGIQGE